jgi:hypothetical protein
LDSSEGAAGGSYDAEHGAAVRVMAPGLEPGDAGREGEPASEEPVSDDPSSWGEPAPPAHRVSQVVPRGTAEDEEASEESPEARHSDVAPRPDVTAEASGAMTPDVTAEVIPDAASDAAPAPAPEPAPSPEPTPSPALVETPPAPRFAIRELRAAMREELGTTLLGPSFGPDEEDEATMVDAAAALSEADRVSMLTAPSSMAETQMVGTPLPAPSQPVPVPVTPPTFADGRHPFKQTMLLGLPRLEPPAAAPAPPAAQPPAAPGSAAPSPTAASDSGAVMASFVRIVGPPTQPPPRRSRRASPGNGDPTTGGLAPADGLEPDHEAFALSNPIGAAEPGRRSSVPAAPPSAPAAAPPSFAAPPAAASAAPPSSAPPSASPSVAAPPSASAAPPAQAPPSSTAVPSSPAAGAAPASLSSLLLPQPARGPRVDASPPALAAAAVGSSSARSLARADISFRSEGAQRGDISWRSEIPRSDISRGDISRGDISLRAELAQRGDASRVSYPPPQRSSYPPGQRVSYPPGQRVSYPPPLRATIDPPTALSRTRPPAMRGSIPPPFAELPMTDPFEGFVAPAPSAAQRWLVVVVVALAVVGLCSLAAIAFGLLGKTGW